MDQRNEEFGDKASWGEPSDEALLGGIRRGSRAALGLLYDRYATTAFTLALAILRDRGLAEDVVHDAFLRVWIQAGTYDSSRGSVRAWLLTIVRNRALDIVRRSRHAESFEVPDLQRSLGDPEAQVLASDLQVRVRNALWSLSDKHREVLILAYFRGLTHREISARLEMPLGSVKSRIREAVRALRRVLLED